MQHIDIESAECELVPAAFAAYINIADKIRDPQIAPRFGDAGWQGGGKSSHTPP
jgi:hypothetical protein